MSMKTPSITLAALGLFVIACTDGTSTGPAANTGASTRPTIAGPMATPGDGSGVVHQVSAGGHDLDIAGTTDANFSLVAIEYGDGSASGQWTDQFGQQEGGFHAEINCLRVVGNQAWVSGTITSGGVPGFSFVGLPVITRVADLGTSANDPPDAISFSFIGNPTPCTAQPNLVLLAMTDGQVSVR
jgi:hypothetical protein